MPPQQPRQKELDFDRGSQLRLLRECTLPEHVGRPGQRVSGSVLRSVLKEIDHAGFGRTVFLAHQTIADRTGHGLGTVKRATRYLRNLGLLAVERSTANRYTIVWSELAIRTPHYCREARRASTRDAAPGPATSAGEGSEERVTLTPSAIDRQQGKGVMVTPERVTVTSEGVMVTPIPLIAHLPPPGTGEAGGGGTEIDWGEVLEALGGIGQRHKFVAEWRAAGRSPRECLDLVRQTTATAEANRRRLVSVAGAVVFFLRTGRWPVEGVRTLETIRAQQHAQQQADRQRHQEADEFRRQQALVRRRGELAHLPAAERRALLVAEYGEQLVAAFDVPFSFSQEFQALRRET